MITLNIEKIRQDFPILQRKVHGNKLVYLDNAASTQKPQCVIDALTNYYKENNANIHRGVHQLSQEASEMYDDAHKKVGKFINAKHPFEETIFVRNATEGMNLIMYGWGMHNLEKGDEILSTVMEHHANIVPWHFLKEKGIKVNFVDIHDDGTLDMEDLKNKVTKKTKVVSCVHGSNVVGTINPVKEISKIAHENESIFIMDGAQSVPHMEVNVKKINPDFMVFSGHKMCAPTGTGALYGKKEILENMHPFLGGGDMISDVKLDGSKYNTLPWRFEAGTPDIGGGYAFGVAVDYLKKIGMNNIRKHEKKLLKYALEEVNNVKDFKLYGPSDPDIRGGLVTFNIGDIHPHDVGGVLDAEFGVAIRTGQHCAQPLIERLGQTSTCRASFYIYNNEEEVDIMVKGLHKIQEIFGK